MAEQSLALTIISPEKTLFEGKVERVLLPGTKGTFEVLPQHAPLMASLQKGTIVCYGEQTVEFDIASGFVEINKNSLTACVVE